jgi:histone H3/H4
LVERLKKGDLNLRQLLWDINEILESTDSDPKELPLEFEDIEEDVVDEDNVFEKLSLYEFIQEEIDSEELAELWLEKNREKIFTDLYLPLVEVVKPKTLFDECPEEWEELQREIYRLADKWEKTEHDDGDGDEEDDEEQDFEEYIEESIRENLRILKEKYEVDVAIYQGREISEELDDEIDLKLSELENLECTLETKVFQTIGNLSNEDGEKEKNLPLDLSAIYDLALSLDNNSLNLPKRKAEIEDGWEKSKRFAAGKEQEPELAEIRMEMNQTDLTIDREMFENLCREILTSQRNQNLDFDDEALEVLQTVAEDYLIDFFRKTTTAAIHRSSQMISPADMKLTKSLS